MIKMLLLSLCCISAVAQATPKPPNMVLIVTDDHGYADVGFNGNSQIPTPNIDRIAAEGARFTQAYVTHPVCGPSRAGLLTGRYQGRFGFSVNPTNDPSDPIAGLPFSEKNLAELVKPMGYHTGILGKWHMGNHPDQHPNNRGFDYFWGFLSGGHRYLPDELVVEDIADSQHGYDWYLTRIIENQQKVNIQDYLTDELSTKAVEFIQREQHNPFLLYVAYNAPHRPLQATKKYLDRFTHIKDERRRIYAAMVSAVDDGVGRILNTLDNQGLTDNTIVVFMSDNGGSAYNASRNTPLRGFKSEPYEGGIHVPLAVRWPDRIAANTLHHQPVISLDIAATLVTHSGAITHQPLDGQDMLAQLDGTAPERPLFWRDYRSGWYAVRMKNWKYVENYNGRNYLFDMTQENPERQDLKAQHPDIRAALAKQIEGWRQHLTSPPFPHLSSWNGNKR
ncbi:sulfatase-like hydrolase/transferase [Bowmanella sp. Y26]|uniref:sulfatase family protein n=1 Tax=Bowmanella yangjiangensis TaxID=2811230 RepID=UPI001BDD3442|nr:sulfatase-like hydrolase/transferase [Bowmanella yangjiangensis]MBT1063368.1 sulfatase-like hydrolase/transferase [Bowmanella yangjiangensis]